MNIGNRIKHFRELSGMSGKKLAETVGLDSSQIYKLEGNSSKPSIDSLEKICQVLNITLSDFFKEQDEPPEHSPEIQKLLMSVKDLPPAYVNKVTDFSLLMHSMLDLKQLEKDLKQPE